MACRHAVVKPFFAVLNAPDFSRVRLIMSDMSAFEFMPRFHGSTFDDMLETFSRQFGPFEASPIAAAPNFAWKTGLWTDDTLTLLTNEFQAEWHLKAVAESPEWLSVLMPHIGGFDVKIGGSTHDVSPGKLLLTHNHQAERVVVRGSSHLSEIIRIDWATVVQTASAILETPFSGSLDLSPMVDLASPAGLLFDNIVRTIAHGMRNNGPLLRSSLAMSHLTQVLIDVVIRTVPHRFSHLLAKQAVSIAPRHVRHAIDFMHANIEKPITMPMVAKAAGVSVRALEMGFRTFREMTPAAYLRSIRLRAVRRDLLDPSNRSSVKDICLKWGFFHFGRFSAAYRTVYGENPSDTRRHASNI